jgi:hypothetical protein
LARRAVINRVRVNIRGAFGTQLQKFQFRRKAKKIAAGAAGAGRGAGMTKDESQMSKGMTKDK